MVRPVVPSTRKVMFELGIGPYRCVLQTLSPLHLPAKVTVVLIPPPSANFGRYIEWMTVRLVGFRDELLAACTETLLSAPVELLGGDIGPLVPALKLALTSGASHLPTAIVAVSALEQWREETPELLMPHLGEVSM